MEDEETKFTYNELTGEAVIEYSGGNVPNVEMGQAFVLTCKYQYGIRVITSVTKSGNKLTLQTEQGTMCDLFKNIDFTLTTNPDLVASSRSTGRVITPTSIELVTGDERTIVYEKSSTSSREVFEYSHKIFDFNQNYSGMSITSPDDEEECATLKWKESKYNIGLDGVFFFDFGEKRLNRVKKGDLRTFKYFLQGNANMDLLMEGSVKHEYFSFGVDTIVSSDVIPCVEVKFAVGTIPVIITLSTDLKRKIELSGEGEASFTAGYKLDADVKLGLEYKVDKGISPITSFTKNFDWYEPEFSVKGSAEAVISFYPQLEIHLYGCLGPFLNFVPRLSSGIYAGTKYTVSDELDYFTWTANVSSGIDTELGLELDMGIFEVSFFEPIDTTLAELKLFETPQSISLQNPKDGSAITLNEEVEVTFLVEGMNYLLDEHLPCKGAVVLFETEGKINNNFAIADENGLVEVKWAPLKKGDNLLAKIVDAEGNVISQAEFNAEIEDDETEKNKEKQWRTLLKQIYDQTNGDAWSRNDNWLSDLPIEDWYGVHTDDITGKMYLNLANNNLAGYIDLDMRVDSLKTDSFIGIYCENNQLTEIKLLGCDALEFLYCFDNPIDTLNVSGCSSLGTLDFTHHPDNLGTLTFLNASGCTSLEKLYCSYNKLTTLLIDGCISLRELDCDENQLKNLDISSCDSLETLRCSNNNLADRQCPKYCVNEKTGFRQ